MFNFIRKLNLLYLCIFQWTNLNHLKLQAVENENQNVESIERERAAQIQNLSNKIIILYCHKNKCKCTYIKSKIVRLTVIEF